MKNRVGWLKHIDFLILDLISLFFSFVVAYYVRHHNLSLFSSRLYITVLLMYLFFDFFYYLLLNPYGDVLKIGYLVELWRTIFHDLLITISVTAYLFIVQSGSEYSRISLFLTFVFYILFSYVTRLMWKKHIRTKARETIENGEKSLLVICRSNEAAEIVNNIRKNNYEFYQISGICIIDKNRKGDMITGCTVVANKNDLLDYISSNWIDDIFISGYELLSEEIIEQLSLTGIPLHIKLGKLKGLNERVQIIDSFASYDTISAVRREYNFFEPIIKRVMDILGGLVGCFITVILIIIIGPIIYSKSPGRIIYVSDRVGKNGKVFKFYKFRSMVMNADDLKKDLEKQNRVKDGMMFKIKDDPRIIPGIGQFIRKTSLDEFPQFFNVLKGDMSLVGTRPPTVDEWKKYSPYYRSRLSIKPGITGLWQISGRSEITDFEEVVRLDNEYINNWSLNLDIKILLKTVLYMFKGDKGAM